MAYTVADVERQLGVAAGDLIADEVQDAIDANDAWAARHLKAAALADPDADVTKGLVMRAAKLYVRKHSPGGWSGSDDLNPLPVRAYDPDISSLLSGALITAGLFGPSANVVEA